ncbi:MAG TPA: hypothetical protein VFT98_21770 [Myxococcota bacterium]|nr:hypothetical protein [Myxococcota bacterium]
MGALALLLCAAATAQERAELVPERAPPWRPTRFFQSLRDGAHAPRKIAITTRPQGARLELAYLRDGVELRRAHGSSPLEVRLPSALRSAAEDRVAIRAELADHVAREISLAASEIPATLEIELAREPAQLHSLALLEIADRARLELRASRELVFRLARSERGWRLALSDAAFDDSFVGRATELRGETIARAAVRATGSDVILELSPVRPDDGRELRLSQRVLPMRGASLIAIEWMPSDGGRAVDLAIGAALGSLRRSDLGECAQRFERSLRGALGEDALAVALSERGGLRGRALTLAIERLAALEPDGAVVLLDGARIPIALDAERARAFAQPERIRGLLIALRALTRGAHATAAEQATLGGWLAPEQSPAELAPALARAAADEAACRASS